MSFAQWWTAFKRLFSGAQPRIATLSTAAAPAVDPGLEPVPAIGSSPVTSVARVAPPVDIDHTVLVSAFVDLLLENNLPGDLTPNEAERYILEELKRLLANGIPDRAVPQLPEVALTLLRELGDPEVAQEKILFHLKRDPAIASEVLRLANSPMFRVGEGRVENPERALMLLGMDTLKSIVSAVLMKPLLDIRPIYFRLFGQDLWQHSLDCAQACQNLVKFYRRGDPFNAYLVGLTHDVGKLAIFRLLIDSFQRIHPDVNPRGAVFSDIVRQQSPALSLYIVRQWSLPEFLITALEEQFTQQSATEVSSYGFVLRQANMLAEFKLISTRMASGEQDIATLMERYGIPAALYAVAFPPEQTEGQRSR